MVKYTWQISEWKNLNTLELYRILQLRAEVFVVEQNCPYQDVDGKDEYAFHLMGLDDQNDLVAYARILHPGISYKEPCIGRVVTSPKVRRKGVGKILLQKAIDFIKAEFGNSPVRISAQSYLQKYYTNSIYKTVCAFAYKC